MAQNPMDPPRGDEIKFTPNRRQPNPGERIEFKQNTSSPRAGGQIRFTPNNEEPNPGRDIKFRSNKEELNIGREIKFRQKKRPKRYEKIDFEQPYRETPLPAFNYILRVEGAFNVPCRSVKGFQKENEYEYIQEGGVNDYVHLRRKAISKPFTFQVERYITSQMAIDPLALGVELILPVILIVYTDQKHEVSPRTFTFTGCTVISKDYGELNGENSSLLVETTTIAYREMICTDIPQSFNNFGFLK